MSETDNKCDFFFCFLQTNQHTSEKYAEIFVFILYLLCNSHQFCLSHSISLQTTNEHLNIQ